MMTTERYVLPSLCHDEEDLVPSSVFANWRRRSSSTPMSNYTSNASTTQTRVASPIISTTPRTSSRQSSKRPPSSYRPTRSVNEQNEAINDRDAILPSPLPGPPTPQKRRSSLTLDAKNRSKVIANNQKNLPSTPISATPSLTYSHSRAGSRSDEDALSSPTGPPQFYRELRDSSYQFYRKGKSAGSVGDLLNRSSGGWTGNESPNADESFLPLSSDGIVSNVNSVGKKKSSTIGFQQKSLRNPDKVAHLLGEEYEESRRLAVHGQVDGRSSISLSSPAKATFKGLFSTIKGKKKKEEDYVDPMESNWERARRLEELEKKKKEAVAKTMALLNEFSLDRNRQSASQKQAKSKKDSSSSQGSNPKDRHKQSEKGKSRDNEKIIGDSILGLQSHPPTLASRDQERPGQTQNLYSRSQTYSLRHRQQLSDDSSTLVSSNGHRRLTRRNSIASIADGNFLQMSGGSNSGGSEMHHSRTPSDLSSGSGSNRYQSANESFLPRSKIVNRSVSIDAISARLQKPSRQEDDEITSFADFGESPSNSSQENSMRHRERRLQQSEKKTDMYANSQSKQSLAEICQRFQDQVADVDCPTPRGLPAQLESMEVLPIIEEPAQPSPSLVAAIPFVHTLSEPCPASTSDLDLLPPLTSLLDKCWTANQKEQIRPWGTEKDRAKLLSISSPREAIPKSWSGYVRAYAKGEFDLNNPPAPRSAPLVKKAIPRQSPMIGSNPSTSSLIGGVPSSPVRKLASKASNNSLGSYRDIPGTFSSRDFGTSHIPNLPPTPPLHHQSFRDRLPSPRFALRKSRSRDVVHENMRLPRDDEDDIRLQAEELAAVGGMGDIRGPRPTWEVERNVSAQQYIDAVSNSSNPTLTSIVERLASKLQVSYAGIQILHGDETVLLASSGLDEGARRSLDVFSTPRIDSFEDCVEEVDQTQSRDCSLDAHTILSRDGNPLIIPNLTQDWRFENREAADMQFYAGASVFASDSGLPIGTVSVMHHQAKDLSKEEKEQFMEAAREVERELEGIMRASLSKKLQEMDDSILNWIRLIMKDSTASSSPSLSQLPASSPLLPSSPSSTSSSRLAERRGARKPVPIDTSPLQSSPSAEQTLLQRLSSALEAIVSTSKMELAYIARVGSHPLQCNILLQKETGVYQVDNTLRPDPAMHLCALASLKSGLQFQNQEEQVRRLLGQESNKVEDAMDLPRFSSALVVGCGLKEGGKSYRGTEGWVLTVASRDQNTHHHRLNAETGAYLMKFATLLGPILLQGPRSPPSQSIELPNLSPQTPMPLSTITSHSRSPASPIFLTPRSSPISQSLDSSSAKRMPAPPPPPVPAQLPSMKKRYPLASPPPSEPLPLPPTSPPTHYRAGNNKILPRPRRLSDLQSSICGRTSISHNEDLEILHSEDGHFEQEKIGRGESPLGLVKP